MFPSRVSNGQRSPRAGSFRPGETVFDQVVRHNQAAAVSVNAAPTGAHTDAASEDHAAQPVAGGAAATNLDFNHKAPKNDAENQNLGQGDGGAGTGTGIGTGGEKRVWKRAPREEAQDEKPAVGGGKKKAPATKQPPGRTTRGVAAAKSKKQATSKPAAQKKGKSKAAVEEADAAAIIEDADPSLSSAPGSKRVGKAVATALNNAPEEEEMFTEGGNGDDSGAMPDWMKDQVAAMEEASPLVSLWINKPHDLTLIHSAYEQSSISYFQWKKIYFASFTCLNASAATCLSVLVA